MGSRLRFLHLLGVTDDVNCDLLKDLGCSEVVPGNSPRE